MQNFVHKSLLLFFPEERDYIFHHNLKGVSGLEKVKNYYFILEVEYSNKATSQKDRRYIVSSHIFIITQFIHKISTAYLVPGTCDPQYLTSNHILQYIIENTKETRFSETPD